MFFLLANDNRLTLDDIQFSGHIEKITDQTSADINWKEIDSLEKRYKLFGQLTEKEYMPEFKNYDGKYLAVIPGAKDQLWQIY